MPGELRAGQVLSPSAVELGGVELLPLVKGDKFVRVDVPTERGARLGELVLDVVRPTPDGLAPEDATAQGQEALGQDFVSAFRAIGGDREAQRECSLLGDLQAAEVPLKAAGLPKSDFDLTHRAGARAATLHTMPAQLQALGKLAQLSGLDVSPLP